MQISAICVELAVSIANIVACGFHYKRQTALFLPPVHQEWISAMSGCMTMTVAPLRSANNTLEGSA